MLNAITHKRISGVVFAVGFGFLASVVFFSPDLLDSYGTDYGAYAYFGQEILRGKVPYLDFFDHKFPLFFYYLGLMQAVFGSGWLALKLISIATYLLSGASFFLLSRSVLRSARWAIVSASIYLFYVTRLDIDPGRNGIIVVFGLTLVFLSFVFLFRILFEIPGGVCSGGCFLGSAIAGLSGGAAFLAKQSFLEPALVGTIALLAGATCEPEKKKTYIVAYLVFAAGYLCSPIALLLYMMNKDSLTLFWDATIRYNMDYARYFTGHPFNVFQSLFEKSILLWGVVMVYLAQIIVSSRRLARSNRLELRPFHHLVLCLLVSTVIFFLTLGADFYYGFPFLSFLILSFVFVLRLHLRDWASACAEYWVQREAGLIVLVPPVALLVILTLLGSGIGITSYLRAVRAWAGYVEKNAFDYRNYPDFAIAATARKLCETGCANQTMFVAGGRDSIYTLSGFDGPYFSYVPLVNDNMVWTPRDVLDNVKAFDPLVVVDWNYRDYFPASSELSDWISKNYDVMARFDRSRNYPYIGGDATLWVRKPRQASAGPPPGGRD